MTTAAIAKRDAHIESLPPDSHRRKVLESLRTFRASWVELGRLLNETVYGGDYKEWGYEDFEVYCARELGLKKPTVQKLMVSYNYMKKYESKRLHDHEEAGGGDLPDLATVELLDKVRRCVTVPEEDIEDMHVKAFNAPSESELNVLRRQLRDAIKPPLDSKREEDAQAARRRQFAGILRMARELRRKVMSAAAVPGGLKDRIERCLVELEALD